MAIQRTRGFVLKREDIRETSVLLTMYTRDFGKIRLISKGARIPEHKFVSAYELLALDDIVFYQKRKNVFFLLSQIELIDFFSRVRLSLERIAYGVYFAELLNLVTPFGEKNKKLYELMFDSLKFLSQGASPKRAARVFEIKMLSELGQMPTLESCASCNAKTENEKTRFSISLGGVICESCYGKDNRARSVSPGTINFISHIRRLPFDRIKQIKVSKKVGFEVEMFLRSFIGYHLDIRPRSMEFINKVGV